MRYVKDSPLELGHRPWQLRPPTPSLTVLVKGTFDPAAGDPAPFAQEQTPVTGEVFVEDDAQNAQRTPTDFALLKPKGECFVIGKAWAPGGRPASMVAASFRIGSIEKSFAVVGDREWKGGLVKTISEPVPFVSMDLSADRAFGGAGHAPNPFGRGKNEIDGKLLLPNLEQPRDFVRAIGSKPEPILLGPLPMLHPERHRYAGTYDEKYMRERWPWLPTDFDWRFFMEAPRDQQLKEGYWRGDERIELNGLHPTIPQIRSHLPRIVPRAFVELMRGTTSSFEEVPLKLDTVIWDGEIAKLLCVWRGLIEVATDTLDEVRYIHVAHEPLAGPHGRPAEHKARMDALLAAEEQEEKEAEGVPPPSFADEEPTTAHHPEIEAPAPPPTPEELELAAQAAAAEKKLAELGVAPAGGESPGADPRTMLEQMRSAGLPVSPEIEAMVEEAERKEEDAPDPPVDVVVPASPPELRGRALLEAKLAANEPLTGLDLTGSDLAGIDLGSRDLSGSILRRVSLAGAKLIRTNLSGCDLSESELVRADLTKANLSGADLVRANLQYADCLSAVLEDADFEEARVVGVRFARAKAARARFVGADLTRSQLAAGDFSEADFERANLDHVDAREAIFRDAVLERASAAEACFDHSVMTKSRGEGLRAKSARFGSIDAEDSYWPRADLTKANFALSKLTRADFTDAILVGAEMDGCNMRNARFDRANAHSLKARKADLMESNFESANLAFADMRGANLFGSELWRANIQDALFHTAILERTKIEGSER